MTKRAAGSRKLSVDDWIEAGYALLADEGIEALKIDRLCGRLGVTKGSFYWHFTDMAALPRRPESRRGASCATTIARQFADMADLPPRERLSQHDDALRRRAPALDPGAGDARVGAHRRRRRRQRARRRPARARAVRQAFLDDGLRPRRGRPAGQRHLRGGHRLPASLRHDAGRPRRRRGRNASSTSCSRADISRPYQKVW